MSAILGSLPRRRRTWLDPERTSMRKSSRRRTHPTRRTRMSSAQEALDRAVNAWNAGDLDGYLRLYRDDITLHGYSPEPMGKEEVRGFYEGVLAGVSGNHLEFHETLWDHD